MIDYFGSFLSVDKYSKLEFYFYPNLYFDFKDTEIQKLIIYDITGKIVTKKKWMNSYF